jgi:hypothetical protein
MQHRQKQQNKTQRAPCLSLHRKLKDCSKIRSPTEKTSELLGLNFLYVSLTTTEPGTQNTDNDDTDMLSEPLAVLNPVHTTGTVTLRSTAHQVFFTVFQQQCQHYLPITIKARYGHEQLHLHRR